MRYTILETKEDLQWAKDVHGLPKQAKFAVLYGNEDAPYVNRVLAQTQAAVERTEREIRPGNEAYTRLIDQRGRVRACRVNVSTCRALRLGSEAGGSKMTPFLNLTIANDDECKPFLVNPNHVVTVGTDEIMQFTFIVLSTGGRIRIEESMSEMMALLDARIKK